MLSSECLYHDTIYRQDSRLPSILNNKINNKSIDFIIKHSLSFYMILFLFLILFYFITMVTNKCCVPCCSQSTANKFSIPKNDYEVWEKIIGCQLNHNSRVCSKHFDHCDIISTWISGKGCYQVTSMFNSIIYFI